MQNAEIVSDLSEALRRGEQRRRRRLAYLAFGPAAAVILLALSACGSPAPVEVTRQVEVIRQVEVPVTVEVPIEVTRQVEVIREVIVTATPSGPQATPQPTADSTTADKGKGSYLVGSEIAPGIWRSSGSGTCDLTINDLSGELVDIALDPVGATFRVPDGQYVVVITSALGSCTWGYLQP